ncbi:MAG: adaptor protein MecA [Oscillospiraceae bacterium]
MEIHQKSENRIIIELSKDDMSTYKLDFSKIDYKSTETKQLINNILYKAEKELGKSFRLDNKMMIDVLPENDGGCIFLFTMSDTQKTNKSEIKNNYTLLMLEPHSLNALFLLAQQLKLHKDAIADCSLYSVERSKLFLIVKPYYLDSEKIAGILSEYGEVKGISPLKLSQIKEHGKLLSKNAITSLTL